MENKPEMGGVPLSMRLLSIPISGPGKVSSTDQVGASPWLPDRGNQG